MNYRILLLFLVISFVACSKANDEGILAAFDNNLNYDAKLKVNIASIYKSNPLMRIKINDQIVSSSITARTPYPGGGYNTNGNSLGSYLSVPPGKVKVSIMIPFISDSLKRNQDSILLYSAEVNLTQGKYYSLHISDTAAQTKSVLFEESLVVPNDTLPYFKFVNLMPNVPAIDLYFGTTVVAQNIKYLESSSEFTVDINSTSTAWSIRPAGSLPTATAIATYTSASTLTRNRKYTAFAMGYSGLAGATEVRRPFVAFYLVK